MKPLVYRFAFVLSFLILGYLSGHSTTLGLGDIAITGYNSDNNNDNTNDRDEFVFVLLTDISGTTVISFTDNGWMSSGSFRSGEGIVTLSITNSYSCGAEIRLDKLVNTWSAFDETGASAGTISQTGNLDLSSSGDQLFAFNGSSLPNSETDPAFITAIDFENGVGWDSNATNGNTSDLPNIFTNNSGNDFSVPHMDNGKFDCSGTNSITSGLPAALRANIYTASNWGFNNDGSNRFDFTDFCNFSCTAACTDPTISSLTTNSTIGSNTFCPGDNVIITITGTKGDATTWNLYSGSCGGTIEDSTPAVDGSTTVTIPSITATTTYYVGGVGGCIASPTCTSILITVNGLTANAGADQKISGSTTANISGNGSGTWSITGVGDGNGYFEGVPGTTSSTIASTTFNGTAGQEYILRWTVTNAGCPSSSDEVVITFLSPTNLGLGDIAFTGLNADNPDEFTFVLLQDINAGTEITFNENGWLSTDGFRVGENAITFEICRPYTCGDEFKVVSTAITDNNGGSAGTVVSGSALALAVGGDQIFAYQGNAPTSGNAANWIAAINTNGPWLTAGTVGTLESYKPSAFTDGTNSISFASIVQNAKYDCSITTNSSANLAAAVNTASNWTTDNNRINLSFCSFTCGTCVEPKLEASDVSAPATACPGNLVSINISGGTLNGADEWAIYTGSCGGTLVGTTTSSSFNVSPTATTTYYVSGRGGCVVTESCQEVTITINALQADAGPDQKVTGATSTTLAGNGTQGGGAWSFADNGDGLGNITDADNPASSFSGTAGQAYTLKWTIDNSGAGCPDTEDEVIITFLDETTLTTGDIAFIAYSADEDDLAFVILKDINAGTTISFTDRGWQSAGGFAGNEGTITVEFCRPYACGTEFNIFDATQEIKDASGQIAGDITGVQLDPSTSGDQIFAYQGTEPTVGNESNFLAAIQMNGPWDADATNTNTSARPAAFTDGVNSLSFASLVQNAYLDCSKVTTASASQINDASNWITSNSTSATLPLNCNLACCTPGVANSISGFGDPLCPFSTQTLLVIGNLNGDQEWVWYTGSCGGTEVKRGSASFNISPAVTTTYYVRAEGTCSGTNGTCASFIAKIEDTVAPEANCPADINVNNDPGLCSAVVNFTATGTDNCGGTVDITYSQNPGTIFNVGTTSVTATATDDTGNQASCSFDVVVTDNEGPTGTCNNMSLDLAANGQVTFNVFAAGGLTNRSDNCGLSGSVGVTGPTLFTCADLGPRPVTIFNRDINGNETPCTVTLTINDPLGVCNQPPVAKCKNISVSADLDQCETTITPAQVNDGSSDPDGDPLTLSLDNSGPFTVGGPYTVELTVSDGSLTDQCTAMVTVTDDQAPTLSNCPGNISVSNHPNNCGALVIWTEPSYNDNCPGGGLTGTHFPGQFFPVGTTTVTYSGVDAAGNTATDCSFTVTVNDTEAPTFSNCPGNISVSNDTGDCGADVNWTPPTLSDNCPAASSSSNFNAGDFFPVGSTTVTYSGQDAAGNTATNCSFTVTVNDTEDPTFSNCPGNISVSNDTGDCGADVSWTPPTFQDNCPAANSSSNFNAGDFFPVGSTTVTYSGQDAAGNTATNCSFTVTVNDTEAPTFSNCPGNISVSNDPGDCGADVNWTPPTFEDNCPGASSSSNYNSGDFFPVGSTTVTYSGEDAAGNDAIDCSFTVTVNDTEAPTFSNCPGNISVSNDVGDCGADVSWTSPTFEDNCPGASSSSNYNSGDFFPVGSTTVTYSGEDAAGNDATDCSFTVTVNDTEAPTFSNCPGNISVSNDVGDCGADVSWTSPTFEDNCSGASSSSNYNSGDFFPVGSTTVTYSGTDAAGNAATDCSFTVTVNDTEAPSFSNCPDNINLFNDPGDCGAIANWTPPTLEDNCPGATADSSHDPGDFFPVGTTTVTYTGTDAAGNDATDCSFTVSVTDIEEPIISCPADISTGTDPGVCGAQVTFIPAIANDNCALEEVKARYRPVDDDNSPIGDWTDRVFDPSGFFPVGRYQVAWRAQDIYGNKRTCFQYLEVYDDEDPVAVCKDLTVDFNGEQDINLTASQVWDEGASSDNCGTVAFVSADLSISCEALGSTLAIPVTIEDGAGNEDVCTAYVNVIGLPCGWSEGPDDGSLNCDGQTTSEYDVDDESFTLTSDGCRLDSDEGDRATYINHQLCGDGTLTAKLASINTGGYAGLMARESLDPWARRAGVLKNFSTRRVRREWRASYGGIVSQSQSNRSRVKWLRIVRKGNEIKSYTSTNGSYWRLLYKVTFSNLEDCIYVGMTAYSTNGGSLVNAVFEEVSLSGNGSLAADLPDSGISLTPEGLQAWGTVGNVGNGTIEVFPNPASNQAQIVLDGFADQPAKLVVRDAFGKLVQQIDLDSALGVVMPLEVQHLPAGFYMISLIQEDRLVISKKLVVQP